MCVVCVCVFGVCSVWCSWGMRVECEVCGVNSVCVRCVCVWCVSVCLCGVCVCG